MDEFDSSDREHNHPDEHREWVWDDLFANNPLPVDNSIYTKYQKSEDGEKKFASHKYYFFILYWRARIKQANIRLILDVQIHIPRFSKFQTEIARIVVRLLPTDMK